MTGRLEAELGNRKRAASLFHKAILNPELTDYCTRELFYLNSKTDCPREMIKTFYSLFAHVFAQDSYLNSSASFEELDVHVLSDLTHQIISGLEDRKLLKEKLEFLYSLRDEESLWSHGLMLEYEDLNERVHQDLYYSYYGFMTMLFQFALASLCGERLTVLNNWIWKYIPSIEQIFLISSSQIFALMSNIDWYICTRRWFGT